MAAADDPRSAAGLGRDDDVLERIRSLVASEHALREQAAGHGGLDDFEEARLRSLEERLDQCWDLLRQRRARVEYGGNPDAAQPRPIGEVEGYLQ